jgi:hypothetical protein
VRTRRRGCAVAINLLAAASQWPASLLPSDRHGARWRCLIGIMASFVLPFAAPANAAPPVLAFTPLTPTTLTLPIDGDAFVLYQVTNQSAMPHSFAMTPIVGVELVSGSSNCSSPFVLNTLQSCILALHLIGSQMVGNVSGGPLVCIGGNPLQCYQPVPADQLRVTLIDDVLFEDGFDAAPSAR